MPVKVALVMLYPQPLLSLGSAAGALATTWVRLRWRLPNHHILVLIHRYASPVARIESIVPVIAYYLQNQQHHDPIMQKKTRSRAALLPCLYLLPGIVERFLGGAVGGHLGQWLTGYKRFEAVGRQGLV